MHTLEFWISCSFLQSSGPVKTFISRQIKFNPLNGNVKTYYGKFINLLLLENVSNETFGWKFQMLYKLTNLQMKSSWFGVGLAK